MKKYLIQISLILALFFSACFRLDSNLFNYSKVDSYQLENYKGYRDIFIDSSYNIPDSLVSIFSLNSNGNKIYAIYIGKINKIKTDTIIMYCHGNKDHMDLYWPREKLLANIGHKNKYGVLMIDYRGYGMSEGSPSEEGLYEDVNTAIEWLKNNGLTNDRFILYGYSLGSAPATKLTAEPRSLSPSKLILEAPFANAETMIQDASALNLPSTYFTDIKINNAEKIIKVNQPFLWIHGISDDFLSIKTHGEIVFKNYKGVYGEAIRVKDAKHDNIEPVMGYKNYLDSLENFIQHK